MKKLVIDPSIAVVLDIDRVGFMERVAVRFVADENWVGAFAVRIYNSAAKNTVVAPEALVIEEKTMTWTIFPTEQNLEAGLHYYEIESVSQKRILFRGNLKIAK